MQSGLVLLSFILVNMFIHCLCLAPNVIPFGKTSQEVDFLLICFFSNCLIPRHFIVQTIYYYYSLSLSHFFTRLFNLLHILLLFFFKRGYALYHRRQQKQSLPFIFSNSLYFRSMAFSLRISIFV